MRPVVPSRLGTPEATARSGDNPLYHPASVGIRRYHPGHDHRSACWGRNGRPRPGTPEAVRGLADQRRRHRAARRSLRAVRWAARPRDRRALEHPARRAAVTSASKVPRVGVVFRPQLPPERLRDFAVSAEAAGLDDVWLWEDCFFEGGVATAGAALACPPGGGGGGGRHAGPHVSRPLRPGRWARRPGLDGPGGSRVRSPMTLRREWVTAVRSLLYGGTVTVSGQ